MATSEFVWEEHFNKLPLGQILYYKFYFALFFLAYRSPSADKLVLVSSKDIADVVAEEITDANSRYRIRYVASDDRTCREIAGVLGKAIGKPDLQWLVLPKEQVLRSLLAHNIPQNTAENLVETGLAVHNGTLREEYDLNYLIRRQGK